MSSASQNIISRKRSMTMSLAPQSHMISPRDSIPQQDIHQSQKPQQLSESRGRKRPAPRGSAAYARKRAVTACQVCRARRTKCDNKKPACSFCEKTGSKCVTESTDYSVFDPASLKILERLERIETLLEGQSSNEYIRQEPPVVDESREREDNLHGIHNDPSKDESDLQHGSFRPLQNISSEVLSWPVFQNRFSMQANAIAVLRRNHHKQPTMTRAGPSTSTASPTLLESFLGNPSASSKLMANFIQHVHIKNPILELASLKRMIQHACLEGVGWDPESCLVLLVWALGAISIPFQQPSQTCSQESLDLGAALFAAATKRLGMAFADGNIILSAQCFFYAGVYLMSIFQPIAAWRHFLQALAYCQEFDFAIQASQSTPQSLASPPDISPIEQRLYWSCWKSEVELRMCLSPFDFQTQDRVYPGHFPNPPANPDKDDRAWFFYLAEISLRRLNTRARNDIGRILPSSPTLTEDGFMVARLLETVATFDRQAEAWLTSLPETISLASDPKDDDILKFILRCHLIDFHELIFWPLVSNTINHDQKNRTTSSVDEMDELTVRGLQTCIDRLRTAGFGYTYRHHGTWMLLQSCIRSAMILLAAAHSDNARDLLPGKWGDSIGDAINMLETWKDEDAGIASQLVVLRQMREGLK